MACILTVDDSRAIRMIVSRVVQEMGFSVAEAEDGIQGLCELEKMEYALVILDVTMPNMDGPAMLAQMRQRGNLTPVLMLTSEAKSSIIADVMKNKIEDYIIKPFKNDELKSKVLKIVKQKDPGILATLGNAQDVSAGSISVADQQAMGISSSVSGEAIARPFCDILVIDDLENVAKKLRSLVPSHFSLTSALTGQAGLKLCREKVFRLLLIDRELPDVQGVVLLKQLRVLQPNAACFAMALKSSPNIGQEVKDEGFDDFLAKPFTGGAIDEMLSRFFDGQELVFRQDNVLAVSAFTGKEDKLDRYFSRVKKLLKDSIEPIAEACYELIIVDATQMPPDVQRKVSVFQELAEASKKFGLSVCLVGSAEMQKVLMSFEETAAVMVFSSVAEARAKLEG